MKTLSRWMPAIAGAVAGGVIAIVVANGASSTSSVTTTVTAPSRQAALPAAFSKSSGMTVNQIYKAASPGVVDIIVTGPQSRGEGSGVVYNTSGYILTDEHVVTGATSVQVNLQNGKSYPAKVIGTDPSTDVGVIKVSAPAAELHPIPLADSSQAQVGDPVVAIGSPFSLPETTTTGIVSQTGRSIKAPNGFTIPNAIQTDAAINPGNSGGPLLDASGHVLGLNDQIETSNTTVTGQGSSSGVGFAIPSNTVKAVADKLIGGGTVKHAYVGVSLDATSTNGAGIGAITRNSPAVAAGLRAGDVVTAINGSPISSTDQFIARIDAFRPGQTVTLTVKRGGQTKQITVTLGTRPAHTPTTG